MPFSLGIDIGTTSIKVAAKTKEGLIELSRPHNATEGAVEVEKRYFRLLISHTLSSVELTRDGIQSVAKLLSACRATIDEVLDAVGDKDLHSIAVCSQQHGVCTWNAEEVREKGIEAAASLLYTWEYTGRNEEQMQQWKSAGFAVNPGYGCVTLAHLEQQGGIDERHDRAGTVGDLLVAILCGDSLTSHSMSDQMAESFGLANCEGRRWLGPATEPGRWQSMLPSIVCAEQKAGDSRLFDRVENAVPVSVALGDLQATMYPLLSDEHSFALNLGTSAQIAFRQSEDEVAAQYEKQLLARPYCRLLPFFNGSNLIVSASMNGGNMVQSLIETRLGYATAAAIPSLLQAADTYAESNPDGPFSVESTGLFHQERGMAAPEALSVARTIATDDRPIPEEEAVAAVCRGVIANLLDLTPLDQGRHRKLLLVGSAGCPRFAIPLMNAFEASAGGGKTMEVMKPEGSTSAAAGAAAFAWSESGL